MVTIDKLDNLSAVLTVTIEKEKYEPRFSKELRKLSSSVSVKGFRPGKAPASLVKNMYGAETLQRVVFDMLDDEMRTYLEGTDLHYLGQPIPAEQQNELPRLSISNPQDLIYKFDLGIEPDSPLKGLTKDSQVTRYNIVPTEDEIEKELEMLTIRFGDEQPTDDTIQANDFLSISLVEILESDAENEQVNPGNTVIQISVNDIKNELWKQIVMSKKTGDAFEFNVFDALNQLDRSVIIERIMGFEAEAEFGERFMATIGEVKRIKPAELNQEFFDKAFGDGKVSSVEEAKAYLKNNITTDSRKLMTDVHFLRDVQDALQTANNNMQLPDAFLMRWLSTTLPENKRDNINEMYTTNYRDEIIDELIRVKLQRQYQVQVDLEEIKKDIRNQYSMMFGMQFGTPINSDDALLEPLVKEALKNQEDIKKRYDNLLASKLLRHASNEMSIIEKEVSFDEFDKIMKEKTKQNKVSKPAQVIEDAIIDTE
ncbi:MAG: hypothetical protein KA974_05240 [Saprospiraceae bacterium]|nr:hypothetical protein [Saprospiraceae bacterium]MBP7699295.1 hypothetical protein [Saprospiraceae bacterium]